MERATLRHQLLRLLGVLVAALPVAFGFVRTISTGDDFRYLWLAAAAILGSLAVMWPEYRGAGSARVAPARVVGAIVSGAACAAATAIVLGATAGPGVAIVAVAFGICTGTGMFLAASSTISRRLNA